MSDGPYGRHGYSANAGYGGGGTAGYGGGGNAYAAPSYGQSYGGAPSSGGAPPAAAYGGGGTSYGDYGAYGGPDASYGVRLQSSFDDDNLWVVGWGDLLAPCGCARDSVITFFVRDSSRCFKNDGISSSIFCVTSWISSDVLSRPIPFFIVVGVDSLYRCTTLKVLTLFFLICYL